MSATQFVQSPGRQFIQSAGRQRNRAFAAIGNYLRRLGVSGFVAVGGFPPFTGAGEALYGHLRVQVTGVIWLGDTNYATHTIVEESFVHPLMCDIYKYQIQYDTGA